MTVKELYEELGKRIEQGFGDMNVYYYGEYGASHITRESMGSALSWWYCESDFGDTVPVEKAFFLNRDMNSDDPYTAKALRELIDESGGNEFPTKITKIRWK